MKSSIKSILLVVLIAFFGKIHAQQFELKITTKDSLNSAILKQIPFKSHHKKIRGVLNEVENISKKLSEIGFIRNSHIIKKEDTIINSIFTLNTKIDSIKIYYKNHFDKSILNTSNIKIFDTYFETSINQLENSLKLIVKYYETKGYSFTSVFIDSIKEKDNILTANLIIEQSGKRHINNIVIKGYDEFPRKFLKYYIGIKKNELFNLKTLKLINSRLNQLNFISQIKEPAILFKKDTTSVYLYLKKNSTNTFDGILGFSNQPSTNKIQFDGYLDLNLNNLFNKGEQLTLNWKSYQKTNKSLHIKYKAPYMFNSPITPSFEFSIFKQDSTYLNSKTSINLNYNLNQNNSINAVLTGEKSNLTQIPSINQLSDFKNLYYGMSYSYHKRANSNSFIPYKFLFITEFLFGNRTIINIKQQQTKLKIVSSYVYTFNSKSQLLLKTTNELLNSPKYYQNEIYRIGGFNSIRGFDEQSIFTSKYSVSSIEYHYNINSKNTIYTVTDIGVLKNDTLNTTQKIYSIGLGLYFKTKQNTIDMSYVIGKNDQNPFNFKDSKFHLKISYPF